MNDVAISIGLGPTLWAYDLSRMTSGVIFMAAAGYALLRGVHIRADFLYRTWSKETQATVDASPYLLLYFPAMLFFLWTAADFWWASFWGGETTMIQPGPRFFACASGDAGRRSPAVPARYPGIIPRVLRHGQGTRSFFFVRLLIPYTILIAVIFASIFFPKVVPFDDWFMSAFGGGFGMSKASIGLLMLGAMLFSIFVGFPISFTLIFLAFTFGSWGAGSAVTFFLMTLQVNSTMMDDQLVAVPLFILMGIVMEQAGLMERLFNAVQLMMR